MERSTVFSLDFYGLRNDSTNEAKLLFWQQDKFSLPLLYLNDKELLNKLKTALSFSEEISYVLKGSLKNLAESLETNATNFSAVLIYWGRLEVEFKKLMLELPEKQGEALCAWFGFVDETAKESFNQTAKSLSSSAAELKAVVNAQGLFNGLRGKLLKTNSVYQEFLPNYKTKGGSK